MTRAADRAVTAAAVAIACVAIGCFAISPLAQSSLVPRACVLCFAAAYLAASLRGGAWIQRPFVAAAACAALAGVAHVLGGDSRSELPGDFSIASVAFGFLGVIASFVAALRRQSRRRHPSTASR